MKKVLFVFGTRPEAIKFAPLIKELQKNTNKYAVRICVTGQHKQMLHQVLDFFEIRPDYDLEVMVPNQTLFSVTAKIIERIEPVLVAENPDLVFVQGDTTTVLMGALGAFYRRVQVAHLEAGLRTGDIYSPFPEELNRIMVSRIADYHFAPTAKAKANLLAEGIKDSKIYQVGNTVIDALFLALEIIHKDEQRFKLNFKDIDFQKKIVLVTCHRRESIGKGLHGICEGIKKIAENNEIEVIFPIHYNPAVRASAKNSGLYKMSNVHIIDPLDYPNLVYIMEKSHIVLTDSGGIQEEAPSLGKPVLVMRDTTERPEGVEAGVARLVGTTTNSIVEEAQKLLDDPAYYRKMANAMNPYGDGTTSKRIAEVLA